jgi:hypothetical protein
MRAAMNMNSAKKTSPSPADCWHTEHELPLMK